MRKTIVAVVVLSILLSLLPGVAAAGSLRNMFSRTAIAGAEYLPDNGELPGLEMSAKPVAYKENAFQKYYGAAGNRYIQYGMIRLVVGEYSFGGKDRRITIELATMETPTAATGLFHYTRAKVVGRGAKEANVGAEGMLDGRREDRNLYFYRSNIFVKIIYSGPKPVPDLTPVAAIIDKNIPRRRGDDTPDGFTFIQIPGVKQETVELTPGFTFNIDLLPPSVWASAPVGGSIASDLFIITRPTKPDADKTFKDYTAYLKFYAEYVEEYKRGNQRYTKAVDPNQGRVVFTAYKNVVIIAARPDGYEKGEALIDAVMRKVDEAGGGRGKGKDRGERAEFPD